MEAETNLNQPDESTQEVKFDIEAQRKEDRSKIYRLGIYQGLTLIGLLVLANNSSISLALIVCLPILLTMYSLADFNCVAPPYKYKWCYYGLAVIFAFGLILGFNLYGEENPGLPELLQRGSYFAATSVGCYFFHFKPSNSSYFSKLSKGFGYFFLLSTQLLSTLMLSGDFTISLCTISFFLIGVLLLYLANHLYINELFSKTAKADVTE